VLHRGVVSRGEHEPEAGPANRFADLLRGEVDRDAEGLEQIG
jgi:hypothetical protein